MKNLFLFFLLLFFLATGVVSGIAYARFIHREECLKLAFDNSGAEILSEEEIQEIMKTLNTGKQQEENNEQQTTELQQNNNKPVENTSSKENDSGGKAYVGSRNSNKFYPINCRFAKLIKEENKVFFGSVEEGEKAGRKYVECK